MDAITSPPAPVNDRVRDYAPGSPERADLTDGAGRPSPSPRELPAVIGGRVALGRR